ncbi:MAG: MFS transporter [Dehalococcoidia bacterium]|nr:MAG: putative arabinose efflux permease, MFS family [Chloroflexota bacterium]
MTNNRLWTIDFALTLLTSFSFFSGAFYLVTVLPNYISEIGGSPFQVGLVVGAWGYLPLVLRLYVGRFSNFSNKKLLIRIGLISLVIVYVLMSFSKTIMALFILRFIQGIGSATIPTASGTLIANITPFSRRGEGLGYFGITSSLGQAVGPAVGAFVLNQYSYEAVFLLSAFTAIYSLGLIHFVKEPQIPKQTKMNHTSLIPKNAILPAALFFSITLCFAACCAFIPLLATERNITQVSFFFIAHGGVSILARPLGGKAGDLFGRIPIVIVGMTCMTVAMISLSMISTNSGMIIVGLFSGLGVSLSNTGLFALALDRVSLNEQGGATAVVQLAWDVGIVISGVGLGLIATQFGVTSIFIAGAFFPFSALLVILFLLKKRVLSFKKAVL